MKEYFINQLKKTDDELSKEIVYKKRKELNNDKILI